MSCEINAEYEELLNHKLCFEKLQINNNNEKKIFRPIKLTLGCFEKFQILTVLMNTIISVILINIDETNLKKYFLMKSFVLFIFEQVFSCYFNLMCQKSPQSLFT